MGMMTMLVGALGVLRQSDLKYMLAHSTIAMLGLMLALLGQANYYGMQAFIVVLVAHALYKASLFKR